MTNNPNIRTSLVPWSAINEWPRLSDEANLKTREMFFIMCSFFSIQPLPKQYPPHHWARTTTRPVI